MNRSRLVDLLAWAGPCVLLGVALWFHARVDTEPPAWDEAVHLRDAWVFHRLITHPGEWDLSRLSAIAKGSDEWPLLRPSGFYPPLVPGVQALAFVLLGPSERLAVLTNLVFLALLAFSVQGLGRAFAGPAAGRVAGAAVLLFPIVARHSVLSMLELPLTALVAASLLALVRAEGFRAAGASLFLGALLGCGLLAKWTFVAFLAGPLAVAAGGALFRPEARRLRNLAACVGVALLVAGPYYTVALPAMIEKVPGFARYAREPGHRDLWSAASALHYFRLLGPELLGITGLIAATLGAIRLARGRLNLFALAGVVVPWAILTFAIQNKQARFLMPWIVWAGVAAGALASLPRIGRFLGVATLVLLGVGAVGTHLEVHGELRSRLGEDWKLDHAVVAIERDWGGRPGAPPRVAVIPNHPFWNGQTLQFQAARLGFAANFVKLTPLFQQDPARFRADRERFAYVILKGRERAAERGLEQPVDVLEAIFLEDRDAYDLLVRLPLPDASIAHVFRRRPLPALR